MLNGLQLECDNKQRRTVELEQWITCLTDSTLIADGGNSMKRQINGVK